MTPSSTFRDRFGTSRALIGVLHVGALPGTPRASESVDALIRRTVDEALVYRAAGFSAVIIENMHDRPYLKGRVGPEITSVMTAVGCEVKRQTGLVLGVQVLAGANREALAVAHACGGDFVRVEGFVFAHVADEGVIESCAGDLLRYRRAIGAERVLVFADIKKKHSAHAITADVPLGETARAAEFFLADGVIVTGVATGVEASAEDVSRGRRRRRHPGARRFWHHPREHRPLRRRARLHRRLRDETGWTVEQPARSRRRAGHGVCVHGAGRPVVTPALVVLGNLLVDDVVFPDGSTRMGQPGGAVLYAALGARLWDVRTGLRERARRRLPDGHDRSAATARHRRISRDSAWTTACGAPSSPPVSRSRRGARMGS